MAFIAALKDDILKKTIDTLNANRTAYVAVVADTGAFAFDAALTEAVFEADEVVATQAYFQSTNPTLSQPFEVVSAPLTNGDDVPFHHGRFSKIDLAKNAKNFPPIDVSIGGDTIAIVAHGFLSGDKVRFITTGGLPSPLSATVDYYVLVVTADIISLYTDPRDVSTIVNLASQGTGVHTIINWIRGLEAESLDDITNALAVGESYVESGAFDFLYKIDNGRGYTPATYWRVFYPEYTRTSLLQCSQNESALLVATTIRLLTRNSSPAPFEFFTQESIRGIEQLARDGMYIEGGAN